MKPVMSLHSDVTELKNKYENHPDLIADLHVYIFPGGDTHLLVRPESVSPMQSISILKAAIKNIRLALKNEPAKNSRKHQRKH